VRTNPSARNSSSARSVTQHGAGVSRDANHEWRLRGVRVRVHDGIVNLFGDTTYEGGASINDQFLGSLGASAAAISIIAGAGEFLAVLRWHRRS
jgi:hypothetical protein